MDLIEFNQNFQKKIRIKQLEKLIIEYRNKYYTDGSSPVSDEVYDRYEDELKKLDPTNKLFTQVGIDIQNTGKIKHKVKMLSLDKTREIDDVIKWANNYEIFATLKMDGISCSIMYEDGNFKLAKTRGNGEVGEDITANVSYINIPKKLKKFNDCYPTEVRGELVISKSNFEKLVDEMASRSLEKPKSMRNIVAGLCNSNKKNDLDLARYLSFVGYELWFQDQKIYDTEENNIEYLLDNNFEVPIYRLISNNLEIQNFIEQYVKIKEGYAYLTDGIVFAINDISLQISQGYTSHHPKGKLAYKLKSQASQTVIEDIEVNVGRTGKLTFVGIVQPVELSGSTIRRVTLHNPKYIEDHRINIGAEIEICKSGEIIPKHLKTINSEGVYQFPTECPLCGTKLIYSETNVDLLCINPQCSSKIYGRIENWIEVLEIKHLGKETLQKLYDKNIIKDIPDLYTLDGLKLSQIDNFGEKSIARILKSINKARKIELHQVIHGIGIPGIGQKASKQIANQYRTISNIMNIENFDRMISIEDFGEVTVRAFHDGMKNYGKQIIRELQLLGIYIKDVKDPSELPLSGQIFVITGALSKPRKYYEKEIELRGGKNSSSVSNKTTYLVCNNPSNTSKFKKATELNIPIINEEKLIEILK